MYNSISIIGNVGGDVDFRYIPSGAPVANFSVAVSYRRQANPTTGAPEVDETQWFRIVCWSNLAEQVQNYVTKGIGVFIEGRFRSRTYTGNDGNERTANEIIARTVRVMGKRTGDAAGPPPTGAPPAGDIGNMEEEIPF